MIGLKAMRRRRLALVLAAAVAVSNCGYALAGRGNTLPTHIKIIGVPGLTNQSNTPGIDDVINRQLREELQGRGGIRALPEAEGADAVLTGVIIRVIPTPTAFNTDRQVSQVTLTVLASVEFRDRKADKVIWANPSVTTQEAYDVTPGTDATDPAALFRQDANAMQRLARALARSIVTQIFEAF
jgi:hypothetical protein